MKNQTHSQKIELLPEHIINQIKAGEVIERPSTLLKEIIENSIDAGSTKIDLHIINNGLDLISICDNGIGIPAKDLSLAFCRHATSKIQRFEDIYHLHSYGFRGEALASIASISRISCESQTQTQLSSIKIDGGITSSEFSEQKKSTRTGTNIFIKDLFFNTPVRMKFIKSKTSEKNQVKKILNAFLLTHPEVNFTIKLDDNDKENFPIVSSVNLEKRINQVLFSNKECTFYSVTNDYDGVNLKAFLTYESNRGNAHKAHYLFINDRFVQDFQLHKIILNSASPLWPEGETGHYITFITLPADELDVNVHPNKTVVKIFKAAKVYSTVSGSIKSLSAKTSANRMIENHQLSQTTFVNSDTQLKDIEYKTSDFSVGDNFNSYFDNLHNKNANEVSKVEGSLESNIAMTILSNESFHLLKRDNCLFLMNTPLFMGNIVLDILANLREADEPVPLLVSRPIKLENKVKESLLEQLNVLGFEIDLLDGKTYVLRTFPKEVQNFSYITLVEKILISNPVSLNDYISDNRNLLFLEATSEQQSRQFFDKLSSLEIAKSNSIITIETNNLKKMYELFK